MDILNSRSIIERMKSVLSVSTDDELAQIINKPSSTIRNWRNRNNFPFEVAIEFANTHSLTLDWLVLGKEENTQDEMETELLARFAKLDFKQKLKLLTSLEDGDFAKSGTHQTAHGNGNNQQVFSGDVGEVVGIRK